MKRTLAVILTMAGATASFAQGTAPSAPAAAAPSASAAPAPAGPAKIAVVAFQAAVLQTNEGQRSLADLRKKFEPKQTQLKAQNDEVEALKKQLQTAGDKLSDTERAARLRTIDEKEKALQRSAEDMQNDSQSEMSEMYNGVAQKVYEVLTSYAQQNGYTLVVDVSQQQSPVMWWTQGSDITRAVIDAYNAKSGVPAPPPGSAPAAAPAPAHTAPRAPASRTAPK